MKCLFLDSGSSTLTILILRRMRSTCRVAFTCFDLQSANVDVSWMILNVQQNGCRSSCLGEGLRGTRLIRISLCICWHHGKWLVVWSDSVHAPSAQMNTEPAMALSGDPPRAEAYMSGTKPARVAAATRTVTVSQRPHQEPTAPGK